MPLFGKGRKGPDQPTTPPILEDVPAQDFILKLSYSAKSSESVRIKTSPSAVARLARMLDGYSQGEPELVEPYPLEFTQAAPFIARMPAAAEWLTYHRKRLPMTRHALVVLESVDAIDLGTHAVGKLEPTDVIRSVNGVKTLTIARLRTVLARAHPGQVVSLGVRRGDETQTVRVQTVADPADPHRAIVGFSPDQAALIKLPLRVQIDAGNVGGPSAGLAFALEVMEKLGHNVARGYKVAATGQMELDGTVSAIGGVKQKTFGVREAKADVFLVPAAGDNAAEARRYAHGLRIIAVKSFPQALRALATLPLRH